MPGLRVSGGDAKGRRLKAPKGIRPTQGMVKQAIFNLVGPAIEGADVLDLFAGSGALGIEALSRGAAGVTFVDHQVRGLAILRQNLDVLGLKEHSRRQQMPALERLQVDRQRRYGDTMVTVFKA